MNLEIFVPSYFRDDQYRKGAHLVGKGRHNVLAVQCKAEYLILLAIVEEIWPVWVCLHKPKLKQLLQTQTHDVLCNLHTEVTWLSFFIRWMMSSLPHSLFSVVGECSGRGVGHWSAQLSALAWCSAQGQSQEQQTDHRQLEAPWSGGGREEDKNYNQNY